MKWKFKKPIFTSITPLTAAAQLSATKFDLYWKYTADFKDLSITPTTLLGFKLYRHIERKTVPTTGGPSKDPTYYPDTITGNFPRYKLIATLPATQFSYTDNLTDLNVHSDEGVYLGGNGRWYDAVGNDIVDEILNTDRRLFYMIEAMDSQMSFNSFPFIYIAHNNGVECRSTITQVKFNIRYEEGDTVWYNNALGAYQTRIAVDPVFDPANNRKLNVWCSGNSTTVTCLRGDNGTVLQTYTIPGAVRIMAIRVDSTTGDAIVTTSKTNLLYRCALNTGATSYLTFTGLKDTNNVGLVLIKEGTLYNTYAITNNEKIIVMPIIGGTVTTYDKNNFGYHPSITGDNIPNIFGVTNGTDNMVWTNGHVPVHYYYEEVYSYQVSQMVGIQWGPCGDGQVHRVCRWDQSADGGRGLCVNGDFDDCAVDRNCRSHPYSNHCYLETQTLTAKRVVNNWFLQDIGYVYGIPGNKTNGYSPYNSTIVGGGGYPPSGSHWYPFTSKDDATRNSAAGYRGTHAFSPTYQAESDKFAFPYTGMNGTDPATAPIPARSQLGLVGDLNDTNQIGSLLGTSYNIWQTNYVEDKIHRLTWSGSDLLYNSYKDVSGNQGVFETDWWYTSAGTHSVVDSQNNVWVIENRVPWAGVGSLNTQLVLIYQLTTSTASIFPNEGTCRWPSYTSITDAVSGITQTYVYGAPYNDEFIEYALTRNTPPATVINAAGLFTAGYGRILAGGASLAQQKATARNWVLSNYDAVGARVYPNYIRRYGSIAFVRDPKANADNQTYLNLEYNSDNNGYLYSVTEHQILSYPAFIRPLETYPITQLEIYGIGSSPSNCDGTFWQDQMLQAKGHLGTSGYDDFKVNFKDNTDRGSFYYLINNYYPDDKIQDWSGDINDRVVIKASTVDNTDYTYHDPSLDGLPNYLSGYPPYPYNTPRHDNGAFSNPSGVALAYHLISCNDNAYWLDGDVYSIHPSLSWMASSADVYNYSNVVSAIIWERWPTANYYINGYDTSSIRLCCLSEWRLNVYPSGVNYPIEEIGEIDDPNRLVVGYDPLTTRFLDWSVSRTQAISEWRWDYGDGLYYGLTNTDAFTLSTAYAKLSDCSVGVFSNTAVDYVRNPQAKEDCISVVPMHQHLYMGPGVYRSTLYVRASNSDTLSMGISSGVTNQELMVWSPYATRLVKVLEVCPGLEVDVITGWTIPPSYSDDRMTTVSADQPATMFEFSAHQGQYYSISGYAPNLTVAVTGIAFARSLPLDKVVVDYRDPFDDTSTAYLVCTVPPASSGWPEWGLPNGYFLSGTHIYTMPGVYDLGIYTIRADVPYTSSLSAEDNSACTTLLKKHTVYVQEIPLTACFSFGLSTFDTSNIVYSGISPITLYFNPSCTTPGSFPICKIVWDFGDGSDLVEIKRLFSFTYSGTSITMNADITGFTHSNIFTADYADPRNIIVHHEYIRTNKLQPSSYVVTMSAYACNTESLNYTASTVATLNLLSLSSLGNIHLIANRIPNETDDVILTLESQQTSMLFNNMVSSQLF